jgi:hypothetical protein
VQLKITHCINRIFNFTVDPTICFHRLGLQIVTSFFDSETLLNVDFMLVNVKKLTSLKLVLRTTIMTPVKPQISKFQADKILLSWLQRVMAALLMSVLSESSRPYMLAYYLFLYVLLLCIGGQVITVSISFNPMSGRENIML